MKDYDIKISISSVVDGVPDTREMVGEYAFREGTHLITYNDYTGNAVTRCGLQITPEKMLLHRTGAFAGNMLFDRHMDTLFSYKAYVVEEDFILHTYDYSCQGSEEGLIIHVSYGLRARHGGDEIRGEQNIRVMFLPWQREDHEEEKIVDKGRDSEKRISAIRERTQEQKDPYPEDWTKRKASEVDIQAFLARLSDMRSGEKTDCPFCGGIVRMMYLKGEEAEFGCESCDMRIQTRVSSWAFEQQKSDI